MGEDSQNTETVLQASSSAPSGRGLAPCAVSLRQLRRAERCVRSPARVPGHCLSAYIIPGTSLEQKSEESLFLSVWPMLACPLRKSQHRMLTGPTPGADGGGPGWASCSQPCASPAPARKRRPGRQALGSRELLSFSSTTVTNKHSFPRRAHEDM